MSRIKLKCGGKRRHKAFFGADGAITAAATLAAAGITAAATASAAKSQAKAVEQNAKVQSDALLQQNESANNLQKEQLAFTRAENQETRKQQQDIQTTLQMMAGQQNMNDIMNANRIQVKYGGSKRKKLKSQQPFYGGGRIGFKVIDGGGVVPIQQYPDGTLYEVVGNDHEHYHKTPSGKNKTGVGIKFNNGNVVEAEGNQNTSKGELMYVTPDDAVFISKHSLKGYNPREAVEEGVHPIIAFNTQETIKALNGYNDDGTKAKYNKRSLKKCGGRLKADLGYYVPGAKITNLNPYNNFKSSRPTSSNGFWNNYGGATLNAAGNLLGAGLNVWANMYAGKKLSEAYNSAGEKMKDAYSRMKGIDMNLLRREDYEAPHTLAVVRGANTNINPQLQRILRNADSEKRAVDRGTMSSAARQIRMAEINDRAMQRANEQYAYKENADEQIKQANAERITQTAQANADRDVQARQAYANQYLALLQYNNQIENAKIAGMAQAEVDALTQATGTTSNAFQTSMSGIGSALTAGTQGFTSVYDSLRKTDRDRTNLLIGVDTENMVNYLAQNPKVYGNRQRAQNQVNAWRESKDPKIREYVRQLQRAYRIA